MPIPARAHFCWIGPTLSWAHAFAVLSAAAQAGLDEVILHHTDELAPTPALAALRAAPGVILAHINPLEILHQAEVKLALEGQLTALYHRLASPVQRADMLRAAILYLQGGIYLDLDTITIAPLRPLLGATQFIGQEYIVWPHWVRASRSPLVWGRHLALDLLRKALRLAPGGWRGFRRVEHWYFPGVNNAVMGATPGASLFAAYLRAMATLPPGAQVPPYALGPDMLQSLIARFTPAELVIHPPAIFYPLPPEISEHWFRPSRPGALARALRPQTLVVHWYASVRSKPHVAVIDPAFIRAHRESQLFSALVSTALPQL